MKKHYILIGMLLFIGMAGCKKHDTLPKIPAPVWTVDNTGKYPESMTAVVQVPDKLKPYITKTDQIGAFVGEECRGTGTWVHNGAISAFFILIHGTAAEQSKISFKYYTSWKSNLYQTDAFLDFSVDGNYGTADGPQVLDLKAVKK